MSPPIPTSSVARSFALIIDGLGIALAKMLARDRSSATLVSLIYRRLILLRNQFTAIAARAQAGTLRGPRRTSGKCLARGVASQRSPRLLPCGFAWLGNMVPESRGYGSQLQHLVLHDPEMAALLAASPQIGRILRSIFWMTTLRPIPEIARRAATARAPRSRAARAVVPAIVLASAALERASPDARTRTPLSPPHRPSAKWPRSCGARPARSRGTARYTAGPPLPD